MIFAKIRNYSYLLEKDCSVVITGDSLAYNRYDFVDEPRMNAWECPLGMRSWSFLLRDHLIRNARGFIPAASLDISGNFKRVPYNEDLPFQGEGIAIKANETTDILIKGCPEFIYFITNPSKAALFHSNAVEINLKGKSDYFEGNSIEIIHSKDGLLENVRNESEMTIIGAAETRVEVNLTGSGSKTAEWMLDNYEDRIGRFKPDICLMIIGANNRRMKDPKSFKAALKSIIERLKGAGCEMVILSPPHSSTTDPPEDPENIFLPDPMITKPILDAIQEMVDEFSLTYMNLFEFFNGFPGKIWRFDNTHFTKEGNLMLFNSLKGALFERREV